MFLIEHKEPATERMPKCVVLANSSPSSPDFPYFDSTPSAKLVKLTNPLQTVCQHKTAQIYTSPLGNS